MNAKPGLLDGRGLALVEKVIARIAGGSATPRRALSLEQIAALYVGDDRPLPPSLARFLAYDAETLGLIEDLERPALRGLSFHEMMRREFGERIADSHDFGDLLPGDCYALPSGSDSRCFMYVGEPDSIGEYPIFMIDTDDTPLLCLEYPGLDVYLAFAFDASSGHEAFAGGLFDDPSYGPAMVEQARRNFFGLKIIDLGGGSAHVDGDAALDETLARMFGASSSEDEPSGTESDFDL